MTKLDLIEYIEKYVRENLDTLDINKGQGRIDWKEDASIAFSIEAKLQDIIGILNYCNLKDIK